MAYSGVQIANLALSRVGVGQAIDSLTEQSTSAIACNAAYAHCVEATLHDFPWPFATVFATLGLVSANPNTDWLYSYQVPSDCLVLRRIVSTAGRLDSIRAPFAIAYSASGRVVFTDTKNAVAEYTLRITDPSLFDATFVDALAWRLAAEIAFPLSVSDSIRQRCLTQHVAAMSAARASALNEVQPDTPPESSYITARD